VKANKRHPERRPSRREPAFEGVVVDIASDGRGVVKRDDGKVFFVKGAWLGERALIKPTAARGSIGFGVAAEVIEASPARQQAPCDHHGFSSAECGGCPWAFVSYEAQCEAKRQRVKKALDKLQPKSGVEVDLIKADAPWGYRNRVQFKTDGKKLGFFGSGSNELVDIWDCPVLSNKNQKTLASLRQTLPNKHWSSDKRRGKYWVNLHIDESSEQPSIDVRLPFRQANDAQNARMLDWLEQVVSPVDDSAEVLELFAGNGNLTQVLAAKFAAVTAVEADMNSVQSIAGNHWPGVETKVCDLFQKKEVDALVAAMTSTDVLVMDPPREGMSLTPALVGGLERLRTVVYISCDVATWARDSAAFIDAGFSFTRVAALDMFPQTPHVEILSVLESPMASPILGHRFSSAEQRVLDD